MDTPSTFRFSSCIELRFTHQSRTIFSWTCANPYQVSSHYKLKKLGIPSFLAIYAKLHRIALDALRITTPSFIYTHSSFVALLIWYAVFLKNLTRLLIITHRFPFLKASRAFPCDFRLKSRILGASAVQNPPDCPVSAFRYADQAGHSAFSAKSRSFIPLVPGETARPSNI